METEGRTTYNDLSLEEKQVIVSIPNPCTNLRDREKMYLLSQSYGVTRTTIRNWRRRIIEEVERARSELSAV